MVIVCLLVFFFFFYLFYFLFFFFFFQAEDGIRDVAVTGVQTCALPILAAGGGSPRIFASPIITATSSPSSSVLKFKATWGFCAMCRNLALFLSLKIDRKSVV